MNHYMELDEAADIMTASAEDRSRGIESHSAQRILTELRRHRRAERRARTTTNDGHTSMSIHEATRTLHESMRGDVNIWRCRAVRTVLKALEEKTTQPDRLVESTEKP